MRLSHPQAPFQGIAPENVFFVANEQQVQMGTGYVTMFFQQEMYPQRPAHIFMQIDAQPSARALMFGALLARADQLRAQYPQTPARIYAQVPPENVELIRFYESCGFANDDGEDMFRFSPPEGLMQAPMGMSFNSVPLEGMAYQQAFLERLNQHRIQPISMDHLQLWQQHQHFMALGFYRGGQPVCEAVFSGTGANATLLMIYTRADCRRQGLARQLLGAAGRLLKERGVVNMYAHVFRRNVPQVALINRLGGTFVKTVTAMPGIDV